MNWKPNSPATANIAVALAPDMLRERKTRSGSSGLATLAWRTRKAISIVERDRSEPQGVQRDPAVVRRRHDRVDAQHQRTCDEQGADGVGAGAQTETSIVGEQPAGHHDRGDADREVDEEDPVPADRLGDETAGDQPDRPAPGGDRVLKTAIAFDRSRGLGKSVTIMPSATADVNEPPTPCTKRAAINITGVVDSPQTSEAVVKTVSPATNTRRPTTRSPSRPARSSNPPKPIR